MVILWDEPKRQANIEKHGFDFADLTEDFSPPLSSSRPMAGD
jgi:uncharacterized DUF497 family protein